MSKEEERENMGPAIEMNSCVISNQSNCFTMNWGNGTVYSTIFNLVAQREGPVKQLISPIVRLDRAVV